MNTFKLLVCYADDNGMIRYMAFYTQESMDETIEKLKMSYPIIYTKKDNLFEFHTQLKDYANFKFPKVETNYEGSAKNISKLTTLNETLHQIADMMPYINYMIDTTSGATLYKRERKTDILRLQKFTAITHDKGADETTTKTEDAENDIFSYIMDKRQQDVEVLMIFDERQKLVWKNDFKLINASKENNIGLPKEDVHTLPKEDIHTLLKEDKEVRYIETEHLIAYLKERIKQLEEKKGIAMQEENLVAAMEYKSRKDEVTNLLFHIQEEE